MESSPARAARFIFYLFRKESVRIGKHNPHGTIHTRIFPTPSLFFRVCTAMKIVPRNTSPAPKVCALRSVISSIRLPGHRIRGISAESLTFPQPEAGRFRPRLGILPQAWTVRLLREDSLSAPAPLLRQSVLKRIIWKELKNFSPKSIPEIQPGIYSRRLCPDAADCSPAFFCLMWLRKLNHARHSCFFRTNCTA